jgi:DNA-nicking Smr family endonuclease
MNKIDLHGIRHLDVQRTLDSFFWEQMQKKSKSVEIVTGISHKMKEIVYETCKDYGFKIVELDFNPGILIVNL